VRGLHFQQFPGGYQIAFTPCQRAEQLVLGLGDDLQIDFLAIAGLVVEVLLERTQAMVFDTNGLALDFAGTVAALVDQYAQGTTGANLGQVAHLARFGHFQRPVQPRDRRHGQR